MVDFSSFDFAAAIKLDFKTAVSLLLSPDNEVTQALLRAAARELLRRTELRAGRELTPEQIRLSARHVQLLADTLNTVANEREGAQDDEP